MSARRVAQFPAHQVTTAHSWTVRVETLTTKQLEDIKRWTKKEAGSEWGKTIPRITLLPDDDSNSIDTLLVQEFADAIRYSTGEGVYKTDCPVFASHGIVRF